MISSPTCLPPLATVTFFFIIIIIIIILMGKYGIKINETYFNNIHYTFKRLNTK